MIFNRMRCLGIPGFCLNYTAASLKSALSRRCRVTGTGFEDLTLVRNTQGKCGAWVSAASSRSRAVLPIHMGKCAFRFDTMAGFRF